MTRGPLLLLLLSLSTCELEDDSVGFIQTLPVVAELSSANSSLSFTAEKESLIKLKLLCYHDTGAFTTAFLRRDDTMQIVTSVSSACAPNNTDTPVYARALIFTDNEEDVKYTIVVTGAEESFYEVKYQVDKARLKADGNSTDDIKLSPAARFSIHTFVLEDYAGDNHQFVDVTVESKDEEVVGKMIVTQSREELFSFLRSPNTSTLNSMRLSYSKFGRIVLSDVSKPKLGPGIWMVGHVLFDDTAEKNISITITPNVDYEYVSRIVILLVVSCFGVILPAFCRYIFNYMNAERHFSFATWRQVVINWFYSGPKGLAYLTGFLAWMLIVSAFQVVNAKWGEMMEKGDRDICYYNERCYRPYVGYYDVSVNGIASNLCFMVHGAIIVVSVSLSETSCFGLKHKHYDYSIPYSFGLAFIFEGFGSMLYHICPSQIIFQFDTLFMFVISQYIITALVDGHAIRSEVFTDADKLVSTKRKTIRAPKLFLFFLGPAYGFNFLGNLHYISPLPPAISFFFFLFLGLWVLAIMLWAAYKANLLPTGCFRPATIHFGDEGPEIREKKPRGWLKIILFGGYCLLVGIGYVMVVSGKLVISIYILGELIVALLIMTAASFVALLCDLWYTLTKVIRKNEKKYPKKFRVLIPAGIVFYLLCGMIMVVVSLFFFVVLENTDKSLPAWESRTLNGPCLLNDFWDAHDLWHFFASHSLMMIVLVVIQMQKPCRQCYMEYKQYEIAPAGEEETGAGREAERRGNDPVVLRVIPLQVEKGDE